MSRDLGSLSGLVVLLQLCKTKKYHKDFFVFILGYFASVAKDDNELPNSLSFFAFFSLGAEDNDKPKGSSSSPNLFSLGAKDDDDKLRSQLIVDFGCFASVV